MSEFYREYLNKHGYLKRRGRGTIGSETPGEGTEPPGSDRLPRAAPRQDDSRPRTPSSTLKVDMKLPHQCLFPQNHSPPMLVGFNLPPSELLQHLPCLSRIPRLAAHEDVGSQEEKERALPQQPSPWPHSRLPWSCRKPRGPHHAWGTLWDGIQAP